MTRKAGVYLRELVSVRGRPESASEHAALLWVLLLGMHTQMSSESNTEEKEEEEEEEEEEE